MRQRRDPFARINVPVRVIGPTKGAPGTYYVRGLHERTEWTEGHSFPTLSDAERFQAECYARNDGADYYVEFNGGNDA